MRVLAKQVEGYIEKSSWIRRMFETGIELKKKHGPDQVFDFSLGNPDVPPPPEVSRALQDLAQNLDRPFALGYMPNAGYADVRGQMAERLSCEQGVGLNAGHVVMTCGAAGAINAFCRAVLDPGDEVVCPAPYFVEYVFYAENFGGKLCPVMSKPLSFELDLAAIDRAICARTRVVIINSPNNPTGQIYSRQEISELAGILEKHSRANGRPVFLLSDEPYRFLAYDGSEVPPVLSAYAYSAIAGSFSKSLSVAGERVGYLAVCPDMADVEQLMGGIVFTNRTLGYVNASAVGQSLVRYTSGVEVDVEIYRNRRSVMARVLEEAGIEFCLPKGAFYFFPRVPGGNDDSAFVRMLMDERIIAVPGAGFGCPGYFRLAFCVDARVIENAAPGFRRTVAKAAGNA